MLYSCPIAGFSVDNRVIRINAFLVALLLAAFILIPNIYIIAFVTVDFALRAFSVPFSFLNYPSKLIRKYFYKADMVDGGSKLFAARIGLGFTVVILLTFLVGATKASQFIALIMIAVSLLNTIFNYCLGCHVHSIIHNFQEKKKEQK